MHLLLHLIKGLSYVPLSVLYALGSIIAPVLEHVVRYRVEVVNKNLERSFPNKSPEERKEIRSQYYRYLADMIVETIKLDSISKKKLLKHVTFLEPELLKELGERKKNVILLMGHSGNWEWAGAATQLNYDARLLPVYRRVKDKVFDDFFIRLRSRFGARPILDKDTMEELRSETELHSVALLADQTPSPKKAIWIEFLNQETPFYRGTEVMMQRMDHTIVFAHIRIQSRGQYRIHLEEYDRASTEVTVTEAFAAFLEKEIREQPYNWLWSHKRWKHKRSED